MIGFVNAKINIGLNIVGRRPDGYHNLNTLFYPIGKRAGLPDSPLPFGDILEIIPGEERFTFYGREIDIPQEKNLVVKAYRLFSEEMRRKGLGDISFQVSLDKHLPDGAGIGGGSADASFVLTLLNGLCDNPFSQSKLLSMAVRLGADCPFFIINTPCYAEGIGEELTPVDIDLSTYHILLVKPNVYVSTAEAFAGVTPQPPAEPLKELIKLPVEEWQGRIVNDFEPAIIRNHPVVGEVKSMMLGCGAVYASMTGSGSSVYGLFANQTDMTGCGEEVMKRMSDAIVRFV